MQIQVLEQQTRRRRFLGRLLRGKASRLGPQALLFLAVLVPLAGAPDEAASTPVLEIDLHAISFADPDTRAAIAQYANDASVLTFVDEQTLAIAFPVRNPHPGLSRRKAPAGGYLLFHTAFIDVHTGKVKWEKTWDNLSEPNAIVGMRNGGYLLRTGNKLTLYSSQPQKISGRELPEGLPSPPRVLTSPTRDAVFVVANPVDPYESVYRAGLDATLQAILARQRAEAQLALQVDVLDGKDLHRRFGFLAPVTDLVAASTTDFAYLRPAKQKHDFQLFDQQLDDLGKATQRSLQPVFTATNPDCVVPYFLTSSTFTLGGVCGKLQVVSQTGAPLGSVGAGDEFISAVVPAEDGRSFATVSSTVLNRAARVRGYPLSFLVLRLDGAYIVWYDAATLKPLLKLQSHTPRFRADAAISPDSSMIAVLIDSVLTTYQNPQSGIAQAGH